MSAESPANPYIGPRPFEPTPQDRQRFFGRERETEELVSWIAGHQVVLVYAESGSGKTSLFNAAVWPSLEALGYEVLPPTRVGGAKPIGADGVNPFVASALAGLGFPTIMTRADLPEALAGLPRIADRRGIPPTRVLVLDQFEELFADRTEDGHRQRDAFFDQVAAAAQADEHLRIVFVLREDYLAELDPYARRVPERFKVRFRLERLGPDAAEQAIVRPLDGTGRTYAPAAVDHLVRELTTVRSLRDGEVVEGPGRYVEPVQLQVVCYALWSELPADATVIGLEDVQRLGDVTARLGDYYEQAVDEVAAATGADALALRRWIGSELITARGTRGTVVRGGDTTGRARVIPTEAVEALVNRHVVRREDRAGAIWYELTHDRFVEPILERNADWEHAHRAALDSPLEAPTEAWREYGKDPGTLLRGPQLERAVLWADMHEDDVSDVERAFLEASVEYRRRHQAVELRRVQRQRWLLASALVVTVGLLAAAVFFFVRAEHEADVAGSRGLAARAQSLRDIGERDDVALLLEVAATDIAETLEARTGLMSALAATAPIARFHALGGPATAFTAAGDTIAAIADEPRGDGFAAVVRAWRAGDGELLLEVPLGYGFAQGLALDATGSRLVFATDQDGSFAVVDLARDARFDVPAAGDEGAAGPRDEVVALAVSPADPDLVATAARDRPVTLWELQSRAPRAVLDHVAGDVAFDGAGARLATGGPDGVRVWDVAEGIELAGAPAAALGDTGATAVAFGPGGELAAGTANGIVYLWRSAEDLTDPVIDTAGVAVNDLAFAADPPTLLIAGGDGAVRLVPVAEGSARMLRGHRAGSPLVGVGLAAGGEVIASAGTDAAVIVWRPATASFGDALQPIEGCGDTGLLAVGVNDAITAVSCRGGHRWDPETGALEPLDFVPPGGAGGFSPDGEAAAIVTPEGIVVVDLDDGTATLVPGSEDATHAAVDGDVLAWTTADGWIVTGDLEGERRAVEPESERLTAVAVSADGTTVAADEGGATFVWDGDPQREPARLEGGAAGPIDELRLARRGEPVAVAGPGAAAQLITDGRVVELFGHGDQVLAVAIDESGEILATGDRLGVVRLWEVPSGLPLVALADIGEAVVSLAFGRDDVLVAGTAAGNVLRWRLDTDALVDVACSKANRNLTTQEWERYVGGDIPYMVQCRDLAVTE